MDPIERIHESLEITKAATYQLVDAVRVSAERGEHGGGGEVLVLGIHGAARPHQQRHQLVTPGAGRQVQRSL